MQQSPDFKWIHVWRNEADPLKSYLIFNSNFGYSDNVIRNLSFTGYIDVQEELNPALNETSAKAMILNIFFKNKYIIDVKFEDKTILADSDLYLHVKEDIDGTPYSVVGKSDYTPDLNGPVTSKNSFLKYRFFSHLSNFNKRQYTFSYTVSHEFMHQILKKSYMYIYEQKPFHEPFTNLNDGHKIGEKNLLFPGDGLCMSANSHLLIIPEDGKPGECGYAFLFSGRYVPSFLKESLDPWEKISNKQKGLLYMYFTLKTLEPNGLNSPEYLLQKEIYNKFITSERYWGREN